MALARWAGGVESEAESKGAESKGVESKKVKSRAKSKKAESGFLDSGGLDRLNGLGGLERLGALAGDLDSSLDFGADFDLDSAWDFGAVDSGVRSRILPIVLFGGSFDPPHLGHMKIIKALCKNPSIARVIIIPAFCNPFKSAPIAPIAKRIEWLERACEGLAKAQVSDIEQRRAKMMYAIEWIEYFHAEFGAKADEKIILALGADALASLHKWKDADKIAKLACVLPITRESKNLDSIFLDSSDIIASAQKKGFMCLKPLSIDAPISSSELRATIKAYKANSANLESKNAESKSLESVPLESKSAKSNADSIDKWLIPNIAAEILKIY